MDMLGQLLNELLGPIPQERADLDEALRATENFSEWAKSNPGRLLNAYIALDKMGRRATKSGDAGFAHECAMTMVIFAVHARRNGQILTGPYVGAISDDALALADLEVRED